MPHLTTAVRNGLIAGLVLASGAALAASGAPEAQPFPDAIAERPVANLAAYDEAVPLGVDPMVTGPVSAGFKARQKALDCERAAWPHIPAGCYPD